jgi:transposase
MRVMAAPRKYSEELKGRATRMALEARQDPATKVGAMGWVADQWVCIARRCGPGFARLRSTRGVRLGISTSDAQKIADLEREVRELRRANTILRQASAFFAAELDRPFR